MTTSKEYLQLDMESKQQQRPCILHTHEVLTLWGDERWRYITNPCSHRPVLNQMLSICITSSFPLEHIALFIYLL